MVTHKEMIKTIGAFLEKQGFNVKYEHRLKNTGSGRRVDIFVDDEVSAFAIEVDTETFRLPNVQNIYVRDIPPSLYKRIVKLKETLKCKTWKVFMEKTVEKIEKQLNNKKERVEV